MKTKFKRLTKEPQYNLLEKNNFRNNQNYIKTNKSFLAYNENIDKYENNLTVKIYGLFLLIFSIFVFLGSTSENKIFIWIYVITGILAIPFFSFITNFKQYLMQSRRKRKYTSIKITNNINYYLILNRFSGKIIKKL